MDATTASSETKDQNKYPSIETIVEKEIFSGDFLLTARVYQELCRDRNLHRGSWMYGEWGFSYKGERIRYLPKEGLSSLAHEDAIKIDPQTRIEEMGFEGAYGAERYSFTVHIDMNCLYPTTRVIVKLTHNGGDESRPRWYVNHKARVFAKIFARNYLRILESKAQ